MNKVLNLILSFAVFFVGWKLFPEIFQFRDAGAVVIVALLRYIIGAAISILLVIGFLATSLTGSIKGVILMVVVSLATVFLFNIIYILIASNVYAGFTFGGGAGALVLTSIALSLFSVDVNSKSKSSNKE